jgi:hypothetical protein
MRFNSCGLVWAIVACLSCRHHFLWRTPHVSLNLLYEACISDLNDDVLCKDVKKFLWIWVSNLIMIDHSTLWAVSCGEAIMSHIMTIMHIKQIEQWHVQSVQFVSTVWCTQPLQCTHIMLYSHFLWAVWQFQFQHQLLYTWCLTASCPSIQCNVCVFRFLRLCLKMNLSSCTYGIRNTYDKMTFLVI